MRVSKPVIVDNIDSALPSGAVSRCFWQLKKAFPINFFEGRFVFYVQLKASSTTLRASATTDYCV